MASPAVDLPGKLHTFDAPIIPTTCKAGVVSNPGPDFKVTIEDVPVPEPGPDEILLRLNATGICFTDIHYMLNDLPIPSMADFGVRSPGHEGAGVVVKLGSRVQNWKIGDLAGVTPIWSTCLNCELCWGPHEMYCEKMVSSGLMVAGSYQQYVVSPSNYTSRIPDNVDDFIAGPIMCSGSTTYASLDKSGLKPGNYAVFPGAGGGVGHMGIQIAKAMGMRVIGIDTGDDKRHLCLRLGCEAFVDFAKVKDVAAEVKRLTGGKGAHGVFVTTGSAAAYKNAPSMLRIGGKIMCIGLPPQKSGATGPEASEYIFRNLHMIGTLVGSMMDTRKALELAERGLLKPACEVYSITQLSEAIVALRSGKVAGRVVVDFNC